MTESDNAIEIQEIHVRIGRNILLYQKIEHVLKLVMPFIHPETVDKDSDSFQEFKELITRNTLGQLMGKLSESWTVSGDHPLVEELVRNEMQKLVDNRNDLVHHLLKMPDMSLSFDFGRQNLIRYLDNNYAEADEYFNETILLIAQFVHTLLLDHLKGSNESKQMN